jgi:hypothetical protein
MKQPISFMLCSLVISLGVTLSSTLAHGHHVGPVPATATASAATHPKAASAARITGQGKLRFRLLYKGDHLPKEAIEVLKSAHGGFAVDRREGKGEIYFALPGAGIIRISADLNTTQLLGTPANVKKENLHNTTIWHGSDGAAYLTFPANGSGQVFTTDLKGKLLHTLSTPTSDDDFEHPTVNDYFLGRGHFTPTDVEQLDGLFYVTTGYSSLDYVLTARILSTNPFKVIWHNLAFGGKGGSPGQFGTAHGITVPSGKKRLDVADRPNSEVERFTRYGHYRSTLALPRGSYPCDIDYLDNYAAVGCLHGPDRSKGAPIYILEGDKLLSTIMPKEDLGLEKFTHIHNAVLHKIGNKFYVIAQAWNPGDFAILEQVTD